MSSSFRPLKKPDSYTGIYYKFFSSSFPHSWPCFSHSTQPKNTPLRFLAPILAVVLQHRFKVLQQKSSPFPDASWLLYAIQFYNSNPFFLHHPLASTPHIYPYFEIHYYSSKSLAQRNSSTTNPIVWRRKYQKECATLLLHSPFYLTFHCQLCEPFFNAIVPSTIHHST
jgi:hypothetical protein